MIAPQFIGSMYVGGQLVGHVSEIRYAGFTVRRSAKFLRMSQRRQKLAILKRKRHDT